ncbi:hypothetical protein LRP49_03700 [Enterovibrio sp. ZSDZ35]|uniref:BPL/LPL catalytic domain-containing protein n=1 Tax=Enterovibrio qingdaonensis TaxID=2899818 RepID=A0ABT5QH64_9GAMM|nr:hypothetical protein [Enterovibrio sp. ZSDZ35]MDD1780298.1 hypothetical protein [Enterovibrio sp. ZSDZ35]
MVFEEQVSLEVIAPKQGLSQELTLFERVANNELDCALTIWRCSNSVVVPYSISQLDTFSYAQSCLTHKGWPVITRQTGGDVVPQSPGSINVALVFKLDKSNVSIAKSYQALCEPIIHALEKLGVSATCSALSGSFCNGDYNITSNGQKLVGTAQRRKKVKGCNEIAVLVHAVILCTTNTYELWSIANEFYNKCNIQKYIEFTKQTSIWELTSDHVENEFELMKNITRDISDEIRKNMISKEVSYEIQLQKEKSTLCHSYR